MCNLSCLCTSIHIIGLSRACVRGGRLRSVRIISCLQLWHVQLVIDEDPFFLNLLHHRERNIESVLSNRFNVRGGRLGSVRIISCLQWHVQLVIEGDPFFPNLLHHRENEIWSPSCQIGLRRCQIPRLCHRPSQ